MYVLFLDENFNTFENIDSFKSFIWVERYIGYGKCELYIPTNDISLSLVDKIKNNHLNGKDIYIYYDKSESMMVAESFNIKYNFEGLSYITIEGRSLESILIRRVIWNQTVLRGKLQGQIKKLLDQNVISPTEPERKINNFVFVESTDPDIIDLTISAQFTGDNLYEAILSICKRFDIGFKITLSEDKNLEFRLYKGEDRSYNQEKNPYVIFSKRFDNLLRTEYVNDIEPLKNVALVAGEDEGSNRRTISIERIGYYGDGTGLSRRELYVDARDIQSETENGDKIPDNEYFDMLIERGNEYLYENLYLKNFDGEVETRNTYVYGKDFYKGDIVQIVTENNIEARVRVDEYIYSEDITGASSYPTFTIIE